MKNTCKNCFIEIPDEYYLCEKCLEKKKSRAGLTATIIVLIICFILSIISYTLANAFGFNKAITIGPILLLLLIKFFRNKAKSIVEKNNSRELPNEIQNHEINISENEDNDSICSTDIEKIRSEKIKKDNISVIETNNTFIDKEDCKNEICNKKRYKLKPILTVIFIFVLLLLGGLNIYQYIQLSKVTNKAETLQESLKEKDKTISALEEEVTDYSVKYKLDTHRLEKELDFYREHVVFVTEDSNYFHSYDCEDFVSDFWAYNTELAIDKGYVPCPNCQ